MRYEEIIDLAIRRLCSIISFSLALFLYFSEHAQTAIGAFDTTEILVRAGVGFVTMVGVLISFSLIPFQRVDQLSTFSVSDYFLKNRNTQFILTFMFIFPLLTFIAAVDNVWLDKKEVFPLWVFGFGVGLDCLREYYYKVCFLIDPFKRVKYLTEKAIHNINDRNFEALGRRIIQASEATYQAIQNKNIVVASHIIDSIKQQACYFLNSIKTENLKILQKNQEQPKRLYDDNSVLASFCSHLEFIYNAGLKFKFEDTCNQVITSLAVISAYTIGLKSTLPVASWTSFTFLPLNSLQYCLSEAHKEKLIRTIETTPGALKALFEILIEKIEEYPEIEEEGKYIIDLLVQCSKDSKNLQNIISSLQRLQATILESKYGERRDLQAISNYITEMISLLDPDSESSNDF